MTIKLKTIRNIAIAAVIITLTFGTGYKLGQKNYQKTLLKSSQAEITNTAQPADIKVDFSLFWNVWKRLEKNFFDREKINSQKMVYGAIKGMVAALQDPYTVFLTPQENKETKDDLQGQFEGIGAQLGLKDKNIVIIAPLEGTPAFKAGLIPGDIILKVDGQDTAGWTLPTAVSKIRGPKGSKVILTILHPATDKSVEVPIIRATIEVKSVETKVPLKTPNDPEAKRLDNLLKQKNISYLRLSRFGDDTNIEWDKQVALIAADYQSGKTKGLILDLRNNPGGYLSGAVYIASEFIEKGVIVKQEKSDRSVQTYSTIKKGRLLSIPLVVLVNKGSASASEIVAGALADYGRAKLVGEKTFGKGSIQESLDLENGAGLHITTAKWILPKGRYINEKGIEPDIKIKLDEEDPTKDLQLEKAIEIL